MERLMKKYGLEVLTFILFLIFLSPFFLVVINSAKNSFQITLNPLKPPTNWLTLFHNIMAILQNPNIRYGSSFVSSIIITAFSLFFISLFSAMAAWVLVRTKSKLSTFFFFMFVAAMVVPFQVVMYPLVMWYKTLSDLTGIPLLQAYQGMIFAYIGFGAPLSIFLFHGFIKSIPIELEESAAIDGCNKLQTFIRIVFPILKPVYVTVLILNGIWIWNDFLLPLIILNKGMAIQTVPLAVANFVGAHVTAWDMVLTATLMAMIPVVILFIFAQKYIIKGMVEGSIK